LDDTLICYAPQVPREPNRAPWWRKLFLGECDEPMRLGAPALLLELQLQGHEIWIYTTSFRAPRDVQRWLRLYGVRISTVVNQEIHERCVRRDQRDGCSKFPPAFHIDLHIDDEEGVAESGARLGFRVLRVAPEDPAWADKVRGTVQVLARGTAAN
jgi:hypothetical protein